MDVAYLYCSADASVGWTSSIPWKTDHLIDLKNCPVSGEPVVMVCDGLVVVAAEKSTSLAEDGDNNDCDNETEGKVTGRVVRFKYGKKTYQLSTVSKIESATTNKSSASQISSGARYGRLGSWFGISAGSSNVNTRTNPTEVFAQDRIAEALELETLKILHKGSLLYNSQSAETSAQSSVSRALLKISDDDWRSANQKKKATLVVMGTRREHRLEEPSRDDSVRKRGILQGLVWIPSRIVYWPCKLALHFVLSFFGPFLPSHMVPGALNGGRGDDRESRPHQD